MVLETLHPPRAQALMGKADRVLVDPPGMPLSQSAHLGGVLVGETPTLSPGSPGVAYLTPLPG